MRNSPKNSSVNLHEVLSFINKASNVQKRAIELSLNKQNIILLTVTEIDSKTEAHRQIVLDRDKQACSIDFVQVFTETGLAPAAIRIERRGNYGN